MADRPPEPKASTREKLCALSCNRCAFRDPEKGNLCNEPIASLEWDYIHAQACHIEAASPKGPRYNPDMTDEERRGFDNLILLCHNHHDLVDKLAPQRFSVEVLKKMKADHEGNCSESGWAAENRELVEWMTKGLELQARYGVANVPPISSVTSPEPNGEAAAAEVPPLTVEGRSEVAPDLESTPGPGSRSGFRGAGLRGGTLRGGNAYGTGAYGTGPYGGESPSQSATAHEEISLSDDPAGGDWSHPVTIQLQQLLGYDHVRADEAMDDGTALIYRTTLRSITDDQARTIEELSATIARKIKLVNLGTGQEWTYP